MDFLCLSCLGFFDLLDLWVDIFSEDRSLYFFSYFSVTVSYHCLVLRDSSHMIGGLLVIVLRRLRLCSYCFHFGCFFSCRFFFWFSFVSLPRFLIFDSYLSFFFYCKFYNCFLMSLSADSNIWVISGLVFCGLFLVLVIGHLFLLLPV